MEADVAVTNRGLLDKFRGLPAMVQFLGFVFTLATSSFVGGMLSRHSLDDIQTLRNLPARVAANDSVLKELRAAVVLGDGRSETLWLYTVCRLDGHDGTCEWILPADLQQRLRNIRLFVRAAPPYMKHDSVP